MDDATTANIDQMWLEIQRVLKVAGRYVCITLAQEHILERMLTYFSSGGFYESTRYFNMYIVIQVNANIGT